MKNSTDFGYQALSKDAYANLASETVLENIERDLRLLAQEIEFPHSLIVQFKRLTIAFNGRTAIRLK